MREHKPTYKHTQSMKGINNITSKVSNRIMALALVGTALVASAPMAKADGIADALTEMEGMGTAVAAGSAAVIAVAVVFVGIKLGKRLLGKI